jgi:hypothetical protein
VRSRAALAAAALLALAACSTATRHQVAPPESGALLGWAPGAAERVDAAPPSPDVQRDCGSATDTYLAEVLHVAPTQAKVLREWGDVGGRGIQVAVSGTLAAFHLGPSDLPMSHVFGDDLSMDLTLDPPFQAFARVLGTGGGGDGDGEGGGRLHVELSSGMIPHHAAPAAPAGETWRQASDRDLTGFQDGFDHPALGDRVLVQGRWIIDCGHANFQTELHPMSFVAWTHAEGATTVARAYAAPYRDAQRYTDDASTLGKVGDPARLTRPDALAFPPYLVQEVVRAATGGTDHLRSQELLEAVDAPIPPWVVCAPAKPTGSPKLQATWDLVARPGVDVRVAPDAASGCATVTAARTSSYRPLDVATRQCPMPWSYLRSGGRAAPGPARRRPPPPPVAGGGGVGGGRGAGPRKHTPG